VADFRASLARSSAAGVIAAALFLCLQPTGAFADDRMGSVTYMEGDVSVVRDGDDVAGISIGSELQNFDLVKTGADGLAELDINSQQCPRMTVKMSSSTQFSLETSTLQGRKQTTIGIIGGQISLKVAKLTGIQDVRVKSDSAVMGVRGTSFTVTAPETGDILVTCDEGDVVCTDDQGKELHAVPGTVVEKQPSVLFRSVPVAATGLEQYRGKWAGERAQVLERNALKMIQANARLYRQLVRQLNAAHAELLKSQAILRKWADEDKRTKIGTRTEIARERLAIGALLARMRQIQFQLERVTFRLLRLKALHDKGAGVGTVDTGLSSAQFFAQVETERRDVAQKLALTRYVAKQYAKRSDGALP
jgi:hypothetical protein